VSARPLLLILNPRDIPECMDSFAALDVPRAYLTGYREADLISVIAELITDTDYSHYVVISDDTVVRPCAVETVYALLDAHPVVTGWCNLDDVDARCSVVDRPLEGATPSRESYSFMHWSRVVTHPEPTLRTWFAGMCLTGMSREMWQRFPFDVLAGSEHGWASDYSLCWRLQQANIPITAARDGSVLHVRQRWDTADVDPRKKLLVGQVPPAVSIVA
jgi:hypothetical protein